MVLAVIGAVVLPRLVAPSIRLFVAWTVGVSPFLYGFAAVMAGSPVALIWVGVLVSLCLLGWIALSAEDRSHQ